MNENTRRRIRNKIAMKFRRKAKSMGKPKEWKNILILGQTFEQALAEAIENYEEGKEPLSPEEAVEEFKRGILGDENEKPTAEPEEKTEYTLDPSVLRMWNRPSEEEREREIQQIAREFNENVEENLKRTICPRCKSSVCRCGD